MLWLLWSLLIIAFVLSVLIFAINYWLSKKILHLMSRMLLSLFKIAVVVSVVIFLINYWLSKKTYLFSPESVANIAQRYKDPANVSLAYDAIHRDFIKAYGAHIIPQDESHWVFMNCGGWMGSMLLLHASFTEYVLFFGTAVDTTGNSGRYWANISDTILTGSFRQWQEGELTSQVFKPGVTVHHYWGEAAAVQWTAGTWMVEYGRGFIPSTLGFALADTLFSTQDFITLGYVLRLYGKALLREGLACLDEMFS